MHRYKRHHSDSNNACECIVSILYNVYYIKLIEKKDIENISRKKFIILFSIFESYFTFFCDCFLTVYGYRTCCWDVYTCVHRYKRHHSDSNMY